MFDKTIHRDEFRLRILLTNQCNKNCHFCLNDFQPKRPAQCVSPMDTVDCLRAYGTFMKSIKEKSIVTFSGGEPGIHPWLDFILHHAKGYCDVIKVVTNGMALNSDRIRYVDCWHVGVTHKDHVVRDFAHHAKDMVVQIVITEDQPNHQLIDIIGFYIKAGIKVKLFADFNCEIQKYLQARIDFFIDHFEEGISTRFTGKQENRGSACAGCEKRCVTLKALWMFPDGSSSTCPQGVVDPFDDDSWDETVEKAYKAHLYR
ncbi:hypothetical protein LCGC14_0855380 [marine sediment metagenome]|uniref:Radical SAM core domain-containing protein n=1 Tax=marine sediment metagenome TaxID=412755 RepID=A0A0F9PUA9_9ZZZZ